MVDWDQSGNGPKGFGIHCRSRAQSAGQADAVRVVVKAGGQDARGPRADQAETRKRATANGREFTRMPEAGVGRVRRWRSPFVSIGVRSGWNSGRRTGAESAWPLGQVPQLRYRQRGRRVVVRVAAERMAQPEPCEGAGGMESGVESLPGAALAGRRSPKRAPRCGVCRCRSLAGSASRDVPAGSPRRTGPTSDGR